MQNQGYYRYPTVYQDQVVFVSEDDLWSVPLAGGVARRLTTGLGAVSCPVFSPDGRHIAFACSDEGNSEVYIIPNTGGEARRVTYLSDTVNVVAWKEGRIIVSTSAGQPFARVNSVISVCEKSGNFERLSLGPVNFMSLNDNGSGGSVIQRHGYREYGFWKRYRGGTAGEIWIDGVGNDQFKKLVDLKGDLARPLWIGNRIYFASDHEGVGNIYACDVDGENLERCTDHQEFYVRNQSTDGKNIVYHAGGDIFVLDVETNQSRLLEIEFYSQAIQKKRKFVGAAAYLQHYALHPKGHHLATVHRGQAFCFSNWEGAVTKLGEESGVRYRLAQWLHDGKRIVMISDEGGEEHLEIYDAANGERSAVMEPGTFGRVLSLHPSPCEDKVLVTTHKNELLLIDLDGFKIEKIDQSGFASIGGTAWSPDGKWVAFGCSMTRHTSCIKLYHMKDQSLTQITDPILIDEAPSFDPEGKYLYFLSHRQFDPSWDTMHFNLGFNYGVRPYLIPLQKDLESPFIQKPKDLDFCEDEKEDDKDSNSKDSKEESAEIQIDLDGIKERLLAFPVHDGNYSQVVGLKGKVAFLDWGIQGTVYTGGAAKKDEGGYLEVFDFENLKVEEIAHDVSDFEVSYDHQTLIYRSERALRIIKAGEKADDVSASEKYTKKGGWIDFDRVRVPIVPAQEWQQMYQEAWRLQRDFFWTEDMSNVDWELVYKRYFPLLSRITSRQDFNDLLWEMQGELGTSHAYVFGGDVKRPPHWATGVLGADFKFDEKHQAYQIHNIATGDSWEPEFSSPFKQMGVNVQNGDLLFALNGKTVQKDQCPAADLVHQAGQVIKVTLGDARGENKRDVLIKTLKSELPARYRDWVEKNRAYVHDKTNGKVGYIHIPDMGVDGFAEFHRSFLREIDREGLIVDVRYNGGGCVSPLLLEKLARKRLGFDMSRWHGVFPYPGDSPAGPMVALTNEYAGSDGDMFSHTFKLMNLGPLIGKRTWGGVVGIEARHHLVDGGMTTQPEYSMWFKDVGWVLENYGVDPDIEVEMTPEDFKNNHDPQMDRGLEEIEKILKASPPLKPDFSNRPNLRLPNSQ